MLRKRLECLDDLRFRFVFTECVLQDQELVLAQCRLDTFFVYDVPDL